jgi:hypothetical protein
MARERTKKFNGQIYTLVTHPKNLFFNKKEKEEKVKELKSKGFLVRTIDSSGYGFTSKKYTIWKK